MSLSMPFPISLYGVIVYLFVPCKALPSTTVCSEPGAGEAMVAMSSPLRFTSILLSVLNGDCPTVFEGA